MRYLGPEKVMVNSFVSLWQRIDLWWLISVVNIARRELQLRNRLSQLLLWARVAFIFLMSNRCRMVKLTVGSFIHGKVGLEWIRKIFNSEPGSKPISTASLWSQFLKFLPLGPCLGLIWWWNIACNIQTLLSPKLFFMFMTITEKQTNAPRMALWGGGDTF